MIYLVILLLLAAASLNAVAEPYQEGPADWKDYHYKIFGLDNGAVLKPEQTLETLEKLNELYRGRNDEGSRKRARIVSRLLKAGKPLEDSAECSHSLIRDYFEIRHIGLPMHNIEPYLKHYRAKRFEECKDRLLVIEKSTVLVQISEEIQDTLRELFGLIEKAKEEGDTVSSIFIPTIIGIHNYMDHHAISPKSLRVLSDYRNEATRLIHRACHMERKTLGRLFIIYKDFEPSLRQQIDDFSKLWMEYDSMCSTILYGYNQVIREAFKLKL